MSEVWRQYDEIETRLTVAVSERMLDLAGVGSGTRLIDLATGRGEPSIRAAARGARVLGVDNTESVLAIAREKLARAPLPNLELRVLDATSLDGVPSAHFGAATCRWGLMYMSSPLAALKSAHRVLKPGGVLVAAFWAEPDRVPYYMLPRRVLERYRSLPAIDFEAPGTFRFAHLPRIERDFSQAGFTIELVEELETPVIEADTAAGIVAWVGAVLGHDSLVPEDRRAAWQAELAAEVEPLRRDGMIRLGGVTRLVAAIAT